MTVLSPEDRRTRFAIAEVRGRTTPEQRANARLIAAAPDLLEAAKAALAYDAAIEHRGFFSASLKPAGGDLPGAVAEGADLDALYLDWQTKVAAAIEKAERGYHPKYSEVPREERAQ